LSLGNEQYLRAAKSGFRMVEEPSYATGGWGPDEHFFAPDNGKLGETLRSTHSSFETPCGAYAHFKITRYLLRITKNPGYGDSMERVLYNMVLGAKPIQPDGSAFLLLRLQFEDAQIRPSRQVAVLLWHSTVGSGRLPDQRLPSRQPRY